MNSLQTPFPLKRHFLLRIVPGLVLFLIALVITTLLGVRTVQRGVYLELATQRAEGIVAGVNNAIPEVWQRLIHRERLNHHEQELLIEAVANEEHEFAISSLKIYNPLGHTIYSTDRSQIGVREEYVADTQALHDVLTNHKPEIEDKSIPGSGEFYELYIPLLSAEGELELVMELYEPVHYLNAVLFETSLPVVLIPSILVLLLMLSMALLVNRAQLDIDQRTNTINSLRRRLESLVSRRAVQAMHLAGELNRIPSGREECTLFFSDVRGFTAFSEANPPDRVIRFLNHLVALQVEVIHRYDGDVDKMIGDAVFARFHGPGRERNAVAAAIGIQQALAKIRMPRGVGIGIYSGEVIEGGIGPESRQDFTVIGDSVNIASRLCSAAAEGEIVCDLETVQRSRHRGFGRGEELQVKGKRQSLHVRRLRPSPSAGI